MINASMQPYHYRTFGEKNEYGEPQLSDFGGFVKMSINIVSQGVTDNVNYKEATYIGLTHDAKVNSTYVIEYEGKRLKVLYVNPKGRLKQVFMAEL